MDIERVVYAGLYETYHLHLFIILILKTYYMSSTMLGRP